MKEFISSAEMADCFGIHKQTLLTLRRSKRSPFREGVDFVWTGLTTNGTLKWDRENAIKAFLGFKRFPSISHITGES